MGDRIAYYHTVKLGTHLITIDPLHARTGRGVVAGIDRTRAYLQQRSPSFLYTLSVVTMELRTVPSERTEEQLAKDLLEEMIALEGISDDGVLRNLVWIEDDAKTTTVSGAETAGNNVDVEIASLSALDVVTNDYVLILGSSDAWVYLVEGTGTGPDKIVLDLTDNLAGGETVYKVSIYYPECRYDGQDPGRKIPKNLNRAKFQKAYTFLSGSQPLWKT